MVIVALVPWPILVPFARIRHGASEVAAEIEIM
jgi:hypothetical protein